MVKPLTPPPDTLDGLKAVAARIEQLAQDRGIDIGPVSEVRVWQLARRQRDPLPLNRTRKPRSRRKADRAAVDAWFARQRFTFFSDAPLSQQ